MPNAAEPGFHLNAKTIGLLVGLTTLMGFGFQGVGYATSLRADITKNASQIEVVQKQMVERDRVTEKLLLKMDVQSEALTELKIAVKSLEATIKDDKPR